MGVSVVPSVITGLTGLGGALIGACATGWNQWRERKQAIRDRQRDELVAFMHAVDEFARSVDQHVGFERGSGPTMVELRDPEVGMSALRPVVNAVSLAHTTVMTGLPHDSLRSVADGIADSVTDVWAVIEFDYLKRRNPNLAFTPRKPLLTNPWDVFAALQDRINKLGDDVRRKYTNG